MTKEEFIKRIGEVEAELVEDKCKFGTTDGLCEYINKHVSHRAMRAFGERFRLFSPYRKYPLWLGSRYTEEGYKTRLKYLAKFKTYSLRFWRYRRY